MLRIYYGLRGFVGGYLWPILGPFFILFFCNLDMQVFFDGILIFGLFWCQESIKGLCVTMGLFEAHLCYVGRLHLVSNQSQLASGDSSNRIII